jgi:hypothetical protein
VAVTKRANVDLAGLDSSQRAFFSIPAVSIEQLYWIKTFIEHAC